jgi:hypothetical protein
MSDARDDAFVRKCRGRREFLELWAVWPDSVECPLAETRYLAELVAEKSDNYQIRCAVGYDETGSPIYGSA